MRSYFANMVLRAIATAVPISVITVSRRYQKVSILMGNSFSKIYSLSVRLVSAVEKAIFLIAFSIALSGCLESSPERDLERSIARLEKKGQNEAAIELFRSRGQGLDPTARTYRYVALSYFGLDQYDKSLDFAKLTLAKDPNDDIAANVFFYSSKMLGKFEEGEALAIEWMNKEDAKDTLRHIAIFYTKWGRYDEAFAASSLGMERLPKDGRMAGVHAFLIALVKDADETERFAKRWSDKNRANAYFWENVGKGLAEIDEHKRALPYLEKSLKIESAVDVASQYLSSLRGSGDVEFGLKWAENWESNQKVDSEFRKMVGTLHFDKGDFEKAVENSRSAVEMDPFNTAALVNLIVSLIELKEYDEAVRTGLEWLSDYSSHANDRTYFYIGDAYAWNGQYQESVGMYETAIRMAPEKSRYVGNLFYAMNKLERFQQVLDFYSEWKLQHPDYSDPHFDKQIAKALAETSSSDI